MRAVNGSERVSANFTLISSSPQRRSKPGHVPQLVFGPAYSQRLVSYQGSAERPNPACKSCAAIDAGRSQNVDGAGSSRPGSVSATFVRKLVANNSPRAIG